MDKERSACRSDRLWVKKYMAEKNCTKHYQAYKSQPESQAVVPKSKPISKSQPEKSTEILKSQVVCPTCKGSGRVPLSMTTLKERELTELPRLLPRRL